MVNHDPSFRAKTKPLVDAPSILNLDNLTCYKLTANCGTFQNSVACNLFSLVVPLSQLFLSVLQASHSVVVYLQNTIRLVSENTENVFSVLLSVK